MTTTSTKPMTTTSAKPATAAWQPELEAAAREIFNVMMGMPLQHTAAEPPLVADVTAMVQRLDRLPPGGAPAGRGNR